MHSTLQSFCKVLLIQSWRCIFLESRLTVWLTCLIKNDSDKNSSGLDSYFAVSSAWRSMLRMVFKALWLSRCLCCHWQVILFLFVFTFIAISFKMTMFSSWCWRWKKLKLICSYCTVELLKLVEQSDQQSHLCYDLHYVHVLNVDYALSCYFHTAALDKLPM